MTIENALKIFQENYQMKNFTQAIEILEKHSNEIDPVIWHYNMGSCLAELGEMPRARYHFLKAEDGGLQTEALRQNQKFVEKKLDVEKWEKSLSASDYMITGARFLGDGPLLTLSLLGLLIFFILYKKIQKTKNLFLMITIVGLFLATNWAIKNMPLKLTMEKLAIYEGPSKIFVPRSEIPPGVIILSLGQDDWEHVIYPSRFEGWIKKSNALKELGE
jgi:hypothetical protein